MKPYLWFGLISLLVLVSMSSAQFLTSARAALASAALDGKIYFGGGLVLPAAVSATIDLFDPVTNLHIGSSSLSHARCRLAATASDSAVFFAGGTTNPNDPTCRLATTRVDVLWKNGTQTTMELSSPRCDLSALRSGRYLYFAGGFANGTYSSVVDRFDMCNNTWLPPLNLKYARSKMGAASWYDMAYFGGGESGSGIPSDRVEVLSNNGSLLGEIVLSVARISPGAVAVQNKIYFFGGTDASGNASTAIDVFYTVNGWASFVLRTQQLTCAREAPHAVLAGSTGAVDWGTLQQCPCFTVDTTSSVNSTSAAVLTDIESTARSPLLGAAAAAIAAQPFSFAVFGGGYSADGVYSSKIQTIRLPGADLPLDYCVYGPPTSPSATTAIPPTTAPIITSTPTVTTPLANTSQPANNNTVPGPTSGGACGPIPFQGLTCRSGVWESDATLQPSAQLANITTPVHIRGEFVVANMSMRYFYPLPMTVDASATLTGVFTFYVNSHNNTKIPSRVPLIRVGDLTQSFSSVHVIDLLACISHSGSYLKFNDTARTLDLYINTNNKCSSAPTGLVVGVIVAVIVLVIAITILVGALWYTGRLESCLGSPSSSSSNSDAKVHMLSSSM